MQILSYRIGEECIRRKITRFTRPIILSARSDSLMVWWIYLVQLGEQPYTFRANGRTALWFSGAIGNIPGTKPSASHTYRWTGGPTQAYFCEKEALNGIADQSSEQLVSLGPISTRTCLCQNARKVSRNFYACICDKCNLNRPSCRFVTDLIKNVS